ncbi:hypothetical protein AC579_4155 [Pseudocercospora musae]|uniref:Heterokaryon incompatibility domain-containing protein n=1 Tax=Pseudocercospora musae TaxID=113226 RepID=A0A139IFP6_9PEZI|nr:hypothetical protein AC579_4155 [Pseudocercospora musae]
MLPKHELLGSTRFEQHQYEKSWQVENMGNVYRKASRTLIYLGEDIHGTTRSTVEALRALALKMSKHVESLCDDDKAAFEKGYLHKIASFNGSRIVSEEDVGPLEHLYQCTWFVRLRIVQEATLAKTNVCFWVK